MIKVLFLGATPLAVTALQWLGTQPCYVVFSDTEDAVIDWLGMKLLLKQGYDIGLNFLATHLIPSDEVTTHTWVNFHPAPLPEYGGRNLAYHAIMNDEFQFGASVHYMDSKFDTGDLINVRRFDVGKVDTAGDLVNKSRSLLLQMFCDWVPELLAAYPRRVPSTPQKETTYYHKEVLNERIVLSKGVERCVRALTVHPKHHAHVVIGGRKYKIVPE